MKDSNITNYINKYISENLDELALLNKELEDNNIALFEKQSNLEKLSLSFDDDANIFIPEALRDSTKDNIESIKYEINVLNDNNKYLNQRIDDRKNRLNELNEIIDYFSSDNKSGDSIPDIIDLCIKLIDVDVNRVKQELFHVKHLLEDK